MKKLKFQYLQPENTHPNDGIRERYPHLRNVYHKKFSTRQERSFYFLHLIEYKNYGNTPIISRYVWRFKKSLNNLYLHS